MFKQGVVFLMLILLSGMMPANAGADGVEIGLIYTTKQAINSASGTDDLLNYRKALENNGGVVIELFQNDEPAVLESKLAKIKGLLIPGGGNMDPKFYNDTPLPGIEIEDPEFDEFCFRVLGYAEKHRLPVLGICRGHQFMNVYFGGSLYQNIPEQYHSDTEVKHRAFEHKYGEDKIVSADHVINISTKSPMYGMFAFQKQVMVNSTHQQAIKDLAPGFDVAASAKDGIIEAIMSSGDVFIMGVQFHPERLLVRDPRFNVLFRKLVEESRLVVGNR
jgi:gamma-glutamyl-gamma-aminobutyrate hydrolase PuuD